MIVFVVLLSFEDKESTSAIHWSETNYVTAEDGTAYTVGYEQTTAHNQDSFVEKKDSKGITLWKIAHAATSANEQAILISIDKEGNPWVVFTVEGESVGEDYITKKFTTPTAFKNVHQNKNEYDGGDKVAVVACLDPEDGKIVKGSFLSFGPNNGKTNNFIIKKIGVDGGEVLLEVETEDLPVATDHTFQKMPTLSGEDNHGFRLQLSMNSGLSEVNEK